MKLICFCLFYLCIDTQNYGFGFRTVCLYYWLLCQMEWTFLFVETMGEESGESSLEQICYG